MKRQQRPGGCNDRCCRARAAAIPATSYSDNSSPSSHNRAFRGWRFPSGAPSRSPSSWKGRSTSLFQRTDETSARPNRHVPSTAGTPARASRTSSAGEAQHVGPLRSINGPMARASMDTGRWHGCALQRLHAIVRTACAISADGLRYGCEARREVRRRWYGAVMAGQRLVPGDHLQPRSCR